ncbi:copper chaperone PCu(A)C [Shimia sp.]|uniref:copper chaperone PCu(A)C n=1 Tax=Shimia sp. TaxID=1954381 RepID=UPI0035682990
MSFKTFATAAVAAITLALPALADSMIMIGDPYARVSSASANSGAAFLSIANHGDEDDRLIAASSDAAKRVELHTHKENAEGVMRMMHVPGGFAVPAGGSHQLMRGGDHVMMMGLTRALEHGDMVTVTLVFEKAGEIVVEVPVDLERKPMHGKMNHGH